jgi:hypothetical protein
MHSKRKFLIGTVIVVCITIIYTSTYIPHKIISIRPDKISSIHIFNGTNGQEITLTNEKDIEHIINNLNSVTFNKENFSFFHMGYLYRLTIFKNNGNIYKKLIIQGSGKIRYNGFFYKDRANSIDKSYISKLFN